MSEKDKMIESLKARRRIGKGDYGWDLSETMQ